MRARMQSTLEAIKQDLSPGQMVDQVLHSVRDGRAHDVASSAVHSVGAMVKANPLPAAVVGIGLVWLAASSRKSASSGASSSSSSSSLSSSTGSGVSSRAAIGADDRAMQRELTLEPRDVESEGAWSSASGTSASGESSGVGAAGEAESRMEHAKERVSHMAHGARAKVHDARAKVSGAAHGAATRAKGVAHTASTKVTSGALRARDATVRTYGEQPLVLGAIAVGVGALLGALLPSTQREDELLGAQRDRVKQRVDAASAEVLGRVKQKVDEGAQRIHAKMEGQSATSASAASPTSSFTSSPSSSASSSADQASGVSTTTPQTDEGDFGGP
jgi:hypothetical protein